ncbi:hypothetical protein FVEN_g7825 [Fusarium venenatum]|nr:hypothetical protein FVEN_g7825 [Fusarium venenatum]
MMSLLHLALAVGFFTEALATGHLPRQTQGPAIRPRAEEHRYVLSPPNHGQIVLYPPPPDRVKGSVSVWTEYLIETGGSTSVIKLLPTYYGSKAYYLMQWIGSDPSYISVETTTSTDAEGATVTGTINKAIDVVKNANGGLDIILSPAFRERVEAILKDVPPCTSRKLRRRQASVCGLEAARNRILDDQGVADVFHEQVHGKISEEAGLESDGDSGYGSGDGSDDGSDDGSNDGSNGGDNGNEGNEVTEGTDQDGFSEGEVGPAGSEAGDTVEAVVLVAEEDAAVIGAAVGEVEGAFVAGGLTLTAVTFLGILLRAADTTGKVDSVYHIPPEDIQTVSKTKSDATKAPTSTSSASTCPTALPECDDNCKVTKVSNAKPTEGNSKGCKCNPKGEEVIHVFDNDFENMILFALGNLNGPDDPGEPEITCPDEFSDVPSLFFGGVADGFCDYIKDNFDDENKDLLFDINGGKIPVLSRRSTELARRAPPEDRDNYLDYKFAVSWIPREGQCLFDRDNMCTEAFKMLIQEQPCGQNHGSAQNRMTVDAKIGVGCGEFKWNVVAPDEPKPQPQPEPQPEPPALGSQECYDRHSHRDVKDSDQGTQATIGCSNFAKDKKIKAGDNEVYWHPIGIAGPSHLNYKISWKEGCNQFEEQSLNDPVDGETCYSLMRANYKSCNNGGAGGYRDAGCLRYEFYV